MPSARVPSTSSSPVSGTLESLRPCSERPFGFRGQTPCSSSRTVSYRPQGPSAANVYIAVDGRKSSTDSLVDWRTSEQPTAHPFDAVGALRLRAGRHTVELIAEPASWLPLCINHDCTPVGAASPGGSFVVAAANLSVLVHPAMTVVSRFLRSDRGPFDLDTAGLLTPDNRLTGPLPFAELLSATVQRGAAAVALGSGWLYAAAPLSSDAMLTFVVDGRHPGNHRASWAKPGPVARG